MSDHSLASALVAGAAVPSALLVRSHLIDVMAVTERARCAMYPVARTSAGVLAEAAVQAREMQSDGWPWMAS